MPAQTLRTTLARDSREPVLLDLPNMTYAGQTLSVRLILRLDDQRIWRGVDMLIDAHVTAAFVSPEGRARRQPADWVRRFTLIADGKTDLL